MAHPLPVARLTGPIVPCGARTNTPDRRRMQVNLVSDRVNVPGPHRRREYVKTVSRKWIALAVVALTATAAVAAAATAGTKHKSAGILACGLMPDTKTSVRWEQFD